MAVPHHGKPGQITWQKYHRPGCRPGSQKGNNKIIYQDMLTRAERGFLIVPFAHTTTKQNCAFSVAGPSLWNGLSLALRLYPRILPNSFYAHLKTLLLAILKLGALLSRHLEGAL